VKKAFKITKMRPDTLAIVEAADQILEEYDAGGYRMTLRQLYYQFISRDIFPDSWIDPVYNRKNGLEPNTKNTEKNYKRLGNTISKGRMSGLLDWDFLEDRGREPVEWTEYASLDQAIERLIRLYRLERWDTQDNYVEVWVEKEALVGVLRDLAYEYHVTLMANKGYSSQSAMYESAKRFMKAEENAKSTWLIYLGDHDPSGDDMVRDVQDRLCLFGSDVTVVKAALTMDQIRQHNPAPNPTKSSDPRGPAYIEKYGASCWELDALNPQQLQEVTRAHLDTYIDQDEYDAVIATEQEHKQMLREVGRKASDG
jgi:hypothetical protein